MLAMRWYRLHNLRKRPDKRRNTTYMRAFASFGHPKGGIKVSLITSGANASKRERLESITKWETPI
jgi:hypothetical protein